MRACFATGMRRVSRSNEPLAGNQSPSPRGRKGYLEVRPARRTQVSHGGTDALASFVDDGEAKTTAGLCGPGPSPEPLEQVGLLLLGNAGTLVGHEQRSIAIEGYRDLAAGRSMA